MQLNLSIGEIKNIIEVASCNLDNSFIIKNISSLENATEQDLSVLLDRGDKSVFDQVSLEKVKNSKAGIIIANKEVIPGKNYLIVKDALSAFTKIVEYKEKANLNKNLKEKISNTAHIDSSAKLDENIIIEDNVIIKNDSQIGSGTHIGCNSFIGQEVTIGKNCKIYPGVKILDRTIIGNNTIIHSGVVIGSDGFGYAVSSTGIAKIPQIGIVKIGSFVEIGANCTIDRSAFDQTVIGNGVKLDNLVHIAHNVIIKDHTVILAQTGIAGGTVIGMGCQIGGQVAIKDHISIGDGAKIVSKSAVMKSVLPGEIVCGIPAIPFIQWKRSSVLINKLPEYHNLLTKIKTFVDARESKKSFWSRIFKK